MKLPIFTTFLPLVLISIAISVVTVVIFAQMHDHAINDAMERSIKDSLTFVKREISAPMRKLQAEALILKEQIVRKDLQAYQPARESFNGTWVYLTTFDDPQVRSNIDDYMIHLQLGKGLYSYVYESFRDSKPYPDADPHSTDPNDFAWVDRSCSSANTCTWSSDLHHTPALDYSWPGKVNYTIVGFREADDTGEYIYTLGLRKLQNTTEDEDGRWVAHEVWVDVDLGHVSALLTYSVPIAFDANGNVVNTISIDMDMTWTGKFLADLNITVSEVSIIFPKTMEVLATSYSSLKPGFKEHPEPSSSAKYLFWTADASPEPLLTSAIKALKSHLGDVAFEDMDDTHHITSNDDHIFSAMPIRESKLDLVVVIVTEKGYYFEEGHRARNEAIIISVVLLVVMVVGMILNAVFLSAPLKVLGDRMIKTAALQDDDDDCTTSVLSEISDMQEAYYTMRSELGRLKSYLPQSVLHGNDTDDDEDEGSVTVNSTLSGKKTAKSSGRDEISSFTESSVHTTLSDKIVHGLNTNSSISSKAVVVMSINLVDFHGMVKQRGSSFSEAQRHYLEVVNKCVRESKGYVDFFQGDHVVATFNAVNNIAVPSKRAAIAAHNIAKHVGELDELRCPVAIGFSTGLAYVGNMGTKDMQRFNIIGAAYARANILQQLATTQLKELFMPSSPTGEKGHEHHSRILTTKDTTMEFDCDLYWQSCDLLQNLPGRTESAKPTIIVAVEHLKNTACAEWMYQLEESENTDPFSVVNAAFQLLADGKKQYAQELAGQLHTPLLGAKRLKELLSM